MIPTFKFHGRVLQQDEYQDLLALLLSKKNELPLEVDPELSKEFLSQVAIKRMEFYHLPFRLSNLFFLISMRTWVNNPGRVMGLLWVCQQYSKKNNTPQVLTVNDFCYMFPLGVPTDQEFDNWWDSQKEGSNNKVDNPDYWVDWVVS